MKLVLLGTGGYFPTKQRHTACLMLPEVGVVLDAGTGMSGVGKHLQTDRLEIFLTHAHLDHIAGLTYLLSVVTPEVQRRSTVYGASAALQAVREHLFAYEIFPVPPAFQFATLDGPRSLAAGGRLSYFPLVHPGGSLGFRLDWPGHSMAYVTDTMATPGANYIEAIRGVDLLVHEAFFVEDVEQLSEKTGHSSLAVVASVAAEANVGRLVVVHSDPQIEDESVYDVAGARRVFGKTELAFDGMEVEF